LDDRPTARGTPIAIPAIGTGATLSAIVDAARAVRADLVGARGGALAAALVPLQEALGVPIAIVAEDADRARQIVHDLDFHNSAAGREAQETLFFPGYELGPYDALIPDRRTSMRRAAVLFRLAVVRGWRFLVAPADAFVRRVAPRDDFEAACLPIAAGDAIDRSALAAVLERGGYGRAPLVEEPGTYALRGAVVDVFPPYLERPLRLELDGDVVERLRAFDPETQIGAEPLAEAWVHPVRLSLGPADDLERAAAAARIRAICDAVDQPTARTDRLIDDLLEGRVFVGAEGFAPAFHEPLFDLLSYLPQEARFCVDNPAGVRLAWQKGAAALDREHARAAERGEPSFPPSRHALSPAQIEEAIAPRVAVASHRLAVIDDALHPLERCAAPIELGAEGTDELGEHLRRISAPGEAVDVLGPLVGHLAALVEEGYRTAIVAHTAGLAARLASMLRERGFPIAEQAPDLARSRPHVEVVVGELARGAVLPGEGLCWIAEEEIFGRRARRHGGGRSTRQTFADLSALKPGDLVVHKEHGVGRYEGLVRQRVREAEVDFLLIAYRDGDKLYVPIHRLSGVQKYRCEGEGAQRLDKLGGQTFSKTRAKAERGALELAAKLLDLYAKREIAEKAPLAAADALYGEFEAAFPFEETADQARAIDEVMADLEAPRSMDRLICGDVGFGKTEVALRAAFRTVMSGRQVAVLVPTTVLAQQHFQSFKARFADYPVRVAMLSRFRTDAENEATALGLKDGAIDIAIGTHRLLSKDVHFKRLGLLVVDEEHRFGVAHKERIRALKAAVDTLVMTATPIPRTLHMAFAGLRDLSLIATAPIDRRPIRTLVCHDDGELLRGAIERELARGGQVYFVHNRVKDIGKIAERVASLVPSARLAVGHGQMREETLERVMLDFVAGQYDVLVCTSIIESGLDIPRANTIVINRADTFGLAQLYQLRGRVGRSSAQAYAYLVVPPIASLSEEARERVETLARYTDLGAGFSVATMDLEIRGAGNLLGAEQSGDIAGVGFEMYLELLGEATARLKGEEVAADLEPEMTFEEPGFFPEELIPDVGQRLKYYKRLASARGEAEVDAIAAEMIDLFGPLSAPAEVAVSGMKAKALARQLRVAGVEVSARRLVVHLGADSRVSPDAVLALVRGAEGTVRLTPDLKVVGAFPKGAEGGVEGAIRTLRALAAYEISTR
jgi:transcription-repair coupling factor (superfamily II helicase)